MIRGNFHTIGKAVVRGEAALKASGLTEYTADHHIPGQLVVKVLRSPHPHARILSIDTGRAEAMNGVAGVVTSKDLPKIKVGRWISDRGVFAWDMVRHIGEAVAAVAAVDEETALKALDLIKVDYEVLPAIFDPIKAMEPGSVMVHEEMASYSPGKRNCQGNILQRDRITIGNADSAFAGADVVHEATYITPLNHPGYTQIHHCIARFDATGKVTVWTSTKTPFGIRQHLALVLGLPMSRVMVVAGMCGGDFGGKGSLILEGICACLAMKTGKPVSLAFTWAEEFSSTFLRTKAITHLKTGVRKDGTIVAMQGQVIHDCGAYMDAVGSTLGPDMAFIQGPYRCPNVDLSAVLVYTNNPPTGHVRGPRCPQEVFPIESHIDEIAHKLNIDPIEMRMRNIMQDGDKLCFGGVLRNVSAGQILEATRDYMKKQKRHPEPNTGWGIALGQYNLHPLPGGMQATSGCVKINDDGTLVLLSGTSEQGAGIVTVLQQIVAEEFGVSMDRVTVSNADSDAAPWERGTGASQTTTRVGAAVRLAAQDARDQLLGLAASKMDVDPKNMTLSQGKVYFNNIEREPVSLKELAAEMVLSRGGPILGTGLNLRKEMFKKIEEEKGIIDGPSYGTSVVKVSVDPDTGEVKVLKCYSIWDAGFAINPSNVEGQIEGGVVCGIGYGLTEDIIVKDGRILNNSLVDYCLPVSTDVPKVETEIMEVPSTWGPYGAKGLAEGANGPVAAAVANAVFNASGVRIRELPLTRERIFMGMKAKNRKG